MLHALFTLPRDPATLGRVRGHCAVTTLPKLAPSVPGLPEREFVLGHVCTAPNHAATVVGPFYKSVESHTDPDGEPLLVERLLLPGEQGWLPYKLRHHRRYAQEAYVMPAHLNTIHQALHHDILFADPMWYTLGCAMETGREELRDVAYELLEVYHDNGGMALPELCRDDYAVNQIHLKARELLQDLHALATGTDTHPNAEAFFHDHFLSNISFGDPVLAQYGAQPVPAAWPQRSAALGWRLDTTVPAPLAITNPAHTLFSPYEMRHAADLIECSGYTDLCLDYRARFTGYMAQMRRETAHHLVNRLHLPTDRPGEVAETLYGVDTAVNAIYQTITLGKQPYRLPLDRVSGMRLTKTFNEEALLEVFAPSGAVVLTVHFDFAALSLVPMSVVRGQF